MFKYLTKNIDASAVIVICGLFIFGYWLLKTSLARKALADAKPRRNSMSIFFPLLVLIVWMVGLIAIILAIEAILSRFIGMADYQKVIIQNAVQGTGSIIISAVALLFVRNYFARGLKGFGLHTKKILKEFIYAVGTLLAVWPIIMAVLILTLQIAKLIYGADYKISPHEELQYIKQYSQVSLRIVVLINGAIVTPVFEEILFRGLFQSAIRSYTVKPWPAIFISSGFFALAHANGTHWPALFVLGVAMGYSYEKDNSLLRPIFVHALFNGLTIIAAMYSAIQS